MTPSIHLFLTCRPFQSERSDWPPLTSLLVPSNCLGPHPSSISPVSLPKFHSIWCWTQQAQMLPPHLLHGSGGSGAKHRLVSGKWWLSAIFPNNWAISEKHQGKACQENHTKATRRGRGHVSLSSLFLVILTVGTTQGHKISGGIASFVAMFRATLSQDSSQQTEPSVVKLKKFLYCQGLELTERRNSLRDNLCQPIHVTEDWYIKYTKN